MTILRLVPQTNKNQSFWSKTIYQEYKGSELVFNTTPDILITEEILKTLFTDGENSYIQNPSKKDKKGIISFHGNPSNELHTLLMQSDITEVCNNFLNNVPLEIVVSDKKMSKISNDYNLSFKFSGVATLNIHLCVKNDGFNNINLFNQTVKVHLTDFLSQVAAASNRYANMNEQNCADYKYKITAKSSRYNHINNNSLTFYSLSSSKLTQSTQVTSGLSYAEMARKHAHS